MNQSIPTPAEHYLAAHRLLAATEESPANAAFLALVHAVLATANPRHVKRKPEPPTTPPRNGGSPTERWLRGDDI